MPNSTWKKLDTTDFAVKNPDWIPELEATVLLQDAPVTLLIDGTLEMSSDYVDCFKTLIDGWLTNRETIAQQTEEHLDRFLPGRKVRLDELLIWGILRILVFRTAPFPPRHSILCVQPRRDYNHSRPTIGSFQVLQE